METETQTQTDEEFEGGPNQIPPEPEGAPTEAKGKPKATTTSGRAKAGRKAGNKGVVAEDPQITLEGEVIDDPDLQGLIGQYLMEKDTAAKARTARNDSYDKIKERFPRDTSGKTFHVGPYTITPILTIGGGTHEVTVGDRCRVTVQARKD